MFLRRTDDDSTSIHANDHDEVEGDEGKITSTRDVHSFRCRPSDVGHVNMPTANEAPVRDVVDRVASV